MIERIRLIADACTACACCVLACPEVFRIDVAWQRFPDRTEPVRIFSVALKDDASRLIVSHEEQILRAADDCPCGVIEIDLA